MRLSLRFVLPLLLVLAGFAYAIVPLVDQFTLRWFVRDLDIKHGGYDWDPAKRSDWQRRLDGPHASLRRCESALPAIDGPEALRTRPHFTETQPCNVP